MTSFILRSQGPTGALMHAGAAHPEQAREDLALFVSAFPLSDHSLYEHPGPGSEAEDCIKVHGDVSLCPAATKIL